MSNLVYPTLPGLTFDCTRTVVAPPVQIRKSPSQREYRARDASSPLYRYQLKYEFLRGGTPQELETLVGFFNQVGGSFDTFLFSDPDDNQASAAQFGLGDGATTSWQLLRPMGGFYEPVQATNGAVAVTLNGGVLNLLQNGAALDTTPWGGSATVTANTTANPINAAVDADTVADSSSTVIQSRSQTVTLPDDSSPYTLSIFVKKTTGGTSPTFALQLQFQGGSTAAYRVTIDTDTGNVLSHTSTLLSYNVTDYTTFWRIDLTGANNSSGNTQALILVYPAYAAHGSFSGDVAQTGSAIVYGAKLEAAAAVGGFTSRYYTWSATTGVVTISPAPASGDVLAWSGKFYRRCRFSSDKLDTTRFMYRLFNANKVEFESVLA